MGSRPCIWLFWERRRSVAYKSEDWYAVISIVWFCSCPGGGSRRRRRQQWAARGPIYTCLVGIAPAAESIFYTSLDKQYFIPSMSMHLYIITSHSYWLFSPSGTLSAGAPSVGSVSSASDPYSSEFCTSHKSPPFWFWSVWESCGSPWGGRWHTVLSFVSESGQWLLSYVLSKVDYLMYINFGVILKLPSGESHEVFLPI